MTSNQDLPNKKAYTNNSTGKPLKDHYQQRYNRSNSRESNGNSRQNSGSRRNSPHPRKKYDKNNNNRKYSKSPNRQENNSRQPDKYKKHDNNYNSHQSPKRNQYGSHYQKKQIHQITTDEGHETDEDYVDFLHSFDGYSDENEETDDYQSAAEEYEIGYMIQVHSTHTVKGPVWILPLLYKTTITSPIKETKHDLEIDFLLDSGASLNLINKATWDEIIF
jgi:hypothetical protein